MIPWLYKNKYYIIECCDNKISINNVFKMKIIQYYQKNLKDRIIVVIYIIIIYVLVIGVIII